MKDLEDLLPNKSLIPPPTEEEELPPPGTHSHTYTLRHSFIVNYKQIYTWLSTVFALHLSSQML